MGGTIGGEGGISMSKADLDSVHESNPEALNHVSRPSSIASTAVLILSGSINVASAAFVLSGYFGAWAASWMVGKLHNILPTLTKNGIIGGSGESNNLLLGKYRLNTLASVGILLLHATGIQSNVIYSRVSDASFVGILWVYSRLVNPILGGLIGCTHVALGAISVLLEHPKTANVLGLLGDIQLKKLGQYVEENDPYISSVDERIPRVPIVTSKPRHAIRASIANVMGSTSLLLAFPQYCLGLYLLGSTLVSWWSSKYLTVIGKGQRNGCGGWVKGYVQPTVRMVSWGVALMLQM